MLYSFFKNIVYLLCFFLTACNYVSYISINVKEPANIVFPADMENAVIFNGVDSPGEADNHVFIDKKREVGTILLKTDTLPTVLCNSLWINLAEQQFFNKIDFFNVPLSGENSEIQSLMEQIDADVMIMLAEMDVKSSLSLKDIPEYELLQSIYEISTQAKFNIAGLHSDWNKTISITDTIFWEAYGWDETEAMMGLPYLNDALLESMHQAANIAMKKMVPHWSVEYRMYYTSMSGRMKNAGKSVENNDWEGALRNWTEEYETESNIIKKAKTAANIALYYEMQNDLENAIIRAKESLTGFESDSKKNKESIAYMRDYILRLELRQKENKLLDIQEGVISN